MVDATLRKTADRSLSDRDGLGRVVLGDAVRGIRAPIREVVVVGVGALQERDAVNGLYGSETIAE